MATWIKLGVWGELSPIMEEARRHLEKRFSSSGKDVYITCIREGSHINGSFHPGGNGIDIRKNGPTKEEIQGFLNEMNFRRRIEVLYLSGQKLGLLFQVIEEKTHYHLEFDPIISN